MLGRVFAKSILREIEYVCFVYQNFHSFAHQVFKNSINVQVANGGKVSKKPGGCNPNHIPKVLEYQTGLPNPQPSHKLNGLVNHELTLVTATCNIITTQEIKSILDSPVLRGTGENKELQIML